MKIEHPLCLVLMRNLIDIKTFLDHRFSFRSEQRSGRDYIVTQEPWRLLP